MIYQCLHCKRHNVVIFDHQLCDECMHVSSIEYALHQEMLSEMDDMPVCDTEIDPDKDTL